MRASLTSSFSHRSHNSLHSPSHAPIPQWVSDMGLEWLYLLLSKTNRRGWV